MTEPTVAFVSASDGLKDERLEKGFTLAEFLISALIFLVMASSLFSILAEIQRTAVNQAEAHAVLNNMRIAMQAIERYIRQAGNDPLGSGLAGITILSSKSVQIISDLTGSDGGNPDKGDPDGDTDASYENITIRFNSVSNTIEIVPDAGPPQIIASYIADILFEYYDETGTPTSVGNAVRKISVTISGSSPLTNLQTHRVFGAKFSSNIRIET